MNNDRSDYMMRGRFIIPGKVSRDPEGRIVHERLPKDTINGRRRWELMLDKEGNEVRVPLTGAASDMFISDYGNRKKAMLASEGWFPLNSCPIGLVSTGQLSRRFLSDAMRAEKACEPSGKPCEHARAIQAERRKAQAERNAEIESRYQNTEKQLLTAQIEQNKLLADLVTQQLGASRPSAAEAHGHDKGKGKRD